MKRFHVHVSVDDLNGSIQFYAKLFATAPAVVKPDYAKWMLEDPRVNFAISKRGRAVGVEHLGIQVEDEGELTDIYTRLDRLGGATIKEDAATCCYAKSAKQWITDPQGVFWETFLTHGESTFYGEDAPEGGLSAGACCTPQILEKNSCRSETEALAAPCCSGEPARVAQAV